MYRILCFSILLFSSFSLSAQSSLEIKKGTALSYLLYTQGQQIPMYISVDSLSEDLVELGWMIDGLGSGVWKITRPALENSVKGWWDSPSDGIEQEFSGDQSILLFSKKQISDLQANKKIEYAGREFFLTPVTDASRLKLDGKELNTHFLQSSDGSSKIWVLKNPNFPAIVKFEGNSYGVDLELSAVK